MHPAADRGTVAALSGEPLTQLFVEVTVNALVAGRSPARDRRISLTAFVRMERRMQRAAIRELIREINEAFQPEEHSNG